MVELPLLAIVDDDADVRVYLDATGPASEFYYNGKSMMAYAPAENLVAVADAPPTVDAALMAAYQKAAIFFPFTDLLGAKVIAVPSAGGAAAAAH